ncbi:hypothetical protein EV639_10540 [Rathayibacter tanaceti]|nr:hypothetical protein EV639_10540 [Rathayibacter tanaceti]
MTYWNSRPSMLWIVSGLVAAAYYVHLLLSGVTEVWEGASVIVIGLAAVVALLVSFVTSKPSTETGETDSRLSGGSDR